ncbi:hypothetical protein OUZ56_010536 [Daphnia magna]|uniref:Uncharacterized protein n=1 Tax=Daphnia magna TaxID=35525 RepID=A0ABR0AIU1_9CRUS|nr:hypothetical protein OUZ56_010536 [Daphnia magna]
MLENFTAIHYINKSSGTKAPALSAISVDIVAWCEEHNLTIEAIHLPGALNVQYPAQKGYCTCRSAIEIAERVQQLETSRYNIPSNSNSLGTEDRPICLSLESTARPLLQLDASAGVNGGRHIPPELERSGREGKSRPDSSGTGLASATIVADNYGTSPPTSPDHSTEHGTAFGHVEQSSPSSDARIPPVSRLGVIVMASKPEAFRNEWSSFLWVETVSPH